MLKIRIRAASLASYCEKCSAWVLEAGEYIFRVGNSSRNTRAAAVLQVPETVAVNRVKHLFADPDGPIEEIRPAGEAQAAPAEEGVTGVPVLTLDPGRIVTAEAEYAGLPEPLEKHGDGVIPFDDVAEGKASPEDFIAQMTEEELAYLMVGNSVDNEGFNSVLGAAAKTLPGAAGETTGKLEEK